MRTIAKAMARYWFRARGAWAIKVHGVHIRTDPDHIPFWRSVGRGRWEPELFDTLDQYLHPEAVFVDVGAWIGPAVIYAARKCKRVYCFEPDPDAYQYLLWNLRLNKLRNVVPFNVALSTRNGLDRVSSPDGRLGGSKSSLLEGHGSGDEAEVMCMRWEDWLGLAIPKHIDVIKMDIEGGEFELIPTMQRYLRDKMPTLHLSLHATFLPDEQREGMLDAVLDSLRHYPVVLDEAGRRSDFNEIRSVAKGQICSALFTNEVRNG